MPELIAQYGLAFVFANVLAERVGLPLPAMPTLILAGALAAVGHLSGYEVELDVPAAFPAVLS